MQLKKEVMKNESNKCVTCNKKIKGNYFFIYWEYYHDNNKCLDFHYTKEEYNELFDSEENEDKQFVYWSKLEKGE